MGILLIASSNCKTLASEVHLRMREALVDGDDRASADGCRDARDIEFRYDPDILEIKRFRDGEMQPVLRSSVRGDHVFYIASTFGSGDAVVEMYFSIRTCVRAGAKSVTVIMPYFAYARQDRMGNERTTVTAKDVMDMIQLAGADALLTIDLHAFQIQGFTNLPHDHIMGVSVFQDYFQQNYTESVICSPDAGGMKRAEMFVMDQQPLVMMSKTRVRANEVATMTFVGDPGAVQGKKVVIIDDIIDTGGTLVKAAQHLMDIGAGSVSAFVTHGVLSDPAREIIAESCLTELVISDSIDHGDTLRGYPITVVSCDAVIAEAILRITSHKSVKAINSVRHRGI